MPATKWLSAAASLPGWAWVAAAVGLVALWAADDRLGTARRAVAQAGDIPRSIQVLTVSGLVGFAVGWMHDLQSLLSLAGGGL